jgi:hypothetical protein
MCNTFKRVGFSLLTVVILFGIVGFGGTIGNIPVLAADPAISWLHQFGTSTADNITSVSSNAFGIFVAGNTSGILPGQSKSGTSDAFVRRYDMTGNILWTRQFGATDNSTSASGVAVDNSGNVYVVGSTTGVFAGQTKLGNEDAFLRKYAVNGSIAWTRQFGVPNNEGGASYFNISTGVAVDSSGSIYVSVDERADRSYLEATYLYKYDNTGNNIWSKGTGFLNSRISVNSNGDIAVIYIGDKHGSKYISVYNSDGINQWTFTGDEYPTLWEPFIYKALVIDEDGNIYITGDDHPGSNMMLRKFNRDGNELWITHFGTSSEDASNAIYIDGNGVYVCGTTDGTFLGQSKTGTLDGFIRSFDFSGNELWTYQFGNPGSVSCNGIAKGNGDANFIVVGSTTGTFSGNTSSGGEDAFLANINSADKPTMEPIAEPQGQYYNTAPVLSNFGFDAVSGLDDGWYQMDSYTGSWTALFSNDNDTSWDQDDWTIPGFATLSQGTHSIYFKASDDVANQKGESGEWKWQFNKDTVAPASPTTLTSTSHTIGKWSDNNTITVTWIEPLDATSGLDGYSISWDNSPITLPDTTKDIEQSVQTAKSPALEDGANYYFHIRAVDNAGNWQANALHLGPFNISVNTPVLSAGTVSPASGTKATQFKYAVTYTDPNNQPPSYVRIGVDNNTLVNMTLRNGQDGDFTNGEIYEYTTSALANGSHKYLFSASDGTNNAIGDTSAHTGPKVGTTSSSGGGGGGGSSTFRISLNGLVSATPLLANSQGILQSAAQLKTSDGTVILDFTNGTKLLTANNNVLSSLTAGILSSRPAPVSGQSIIAAYVFGPDGAIIYPALTLTMSYDPSKLPPGIEEKSLYIGYYDGTQWQPLVSKVDPATRIVTAKIAQLSVYALLGAIPAPSPASFLLGNPTITPTEANPGQDINFSISVTNGGGSSGSYNIQLKINNDPVVNQNITLDAGKSQTVTFISKAGQAGSYNVDINGKIGQFTVKALPNATTPTQLPTAAQAPSPTVTTVTALALSPTATLTSGSTVTPVKAPGKPASPNIVWWIVLAIAIIASGITAVIVYRQGKSKK